MRASELQINELQAVSDIRDFQREPMAREKGYGNEWNEADRWIEQADAIAKKYGFTRYGKGEFAGVYGKPGYNFIIKLFAIEDHGFQEYLGFVRTHQSNPYVPKLKGKPVKVTPTVAAVQMEKLTPVRIQGLVNRFEELVMDYDGIMSYWKDPNAPSDSWADYDYDSKTLEILKFFPNVRTDANLQEICQYLTNFYGDIDIHAGNLMMRGDQLVVTDPLAFV